MLESDSDKLKFIKSLLDKQFKNIEPNLSGMVEFAYKSQKHSIDSQVNGFLIKVTKGAYVPPTEGATVQEKEKGEEKEEVKGQLKDFILVDSKIITDPLPILEYYQAQLNGMVRENNNVAWQPMVKGWFNSNIGGDFKDNLHAKNSFKKFYMNNLKPKFKQETVTVYKPGRAFGEGQ